MNKKENPGKYKSYYLDKECLDIMKALPESVNKSLFVRTAIINQALTDRVSEAHKLSEK
jgi:hypothetical protein